VGRVGRGRQSSVGSGEVVERARCPISESGLAGPHNSAPAPLKLRNGTLLGICTIRRPRLRARPGTAPNWTANAWQAHGTAAFPRGWRGWQGRQNASCILAAPSLGLQGLQGLAGPQQPPRVRFMARQISSELLGPRVWHRLPILSVRCHVAAGCLVARCLFLVLSPRARDALNPAP
jgi:hypothetical protein